MGEERKRSLRKRAKASQEVDWSKISASHYVGYVEDEESVEAIMKKFEELEKLKEEVASKKSKVEASNQNTEEEEEEEEYETFGLASFLEPEPKPKKSVLSQANLPSESVELTQEQLEELFVRTSMFSIESAATQYDTPDWWDINGNISEFNSEQDEEYLDYSDDEWEEEMNSKSRKAKRSGIKRASRGRNVDRATQRELIMKRYREMNLQDDSGNLLAMLKKVQLVDPSLPTYVKVPPNPMPLSWARRIAPLQKVNGVQNNFELNIMKNLKKLKEFGNSFQAILIDPPLLLDDEDATPEKLKSYPPHRKPIRFKEFKKLPIPDLIHTGFLMIWIEKHHLHEVLKHFVEVWGFRYVENLAWVHFNMNNTISKKPSSLPPNLDNEGCNEGYFKSSKSTLLIFRIGGDIDLRHQRSPDVIFDQIRPSNHIGNMMYKNTCLDKPAFIYNLIETLLPGLNKSNQTDGDQSNGVSKSPYRFLELWASPSRIKSATAPWISIVDKEC